jgi:hypothetical protein
MDVDEEYTRFEWGPIARGGRSSTGESGFGRPLVTNESAGSGSGGSEIGPAVSAVTGAVSKAAEGGMKRFEVAKKRHINQLFVRGDNVVLVAEYHHEI